MSETVKEVQVLAKECQLTGVQVYLDRAEVTREVDTNTLAAGVTKLTVTHLVDSLDSNTVRVRGNRRCRILEVSQDRRVLEKSDEGSTGLLKKRDQREALRKRISAKELELKRVQKRLAFAEQFVDSSFKQPGSAAAAGSNGKLSLTEAREILDWHQAENDTTAVTTTALQNDIADLQQEMATINAEIAKLTGGGGSRTTGNNSVSGSGGVNYHRTVTITVDCSAAATTGDDISAGAGTDTGTSVSASTGVSPPLVLSYVVSDASWAPSYDIRISTTTPPAATSTATATATAAGAGAATSTSTRLLQLVYFAEVKQHSGEDWSDVDLALSTSDPSLSSKPKPLLALQARRIRHQYNDINIMRKGGKKGFGGFPQQQKQMMNMQQQSAPSAPPPALAMAMARRGAPGGARDSDSDDMEANDDDEDDDDGSGGGAFGASATVNQLTTGFTIPRKCNIDSDNLPHKVVIADVTLNTEIVHYAAPCTGDVSVYLQSKTNNSSPYVLLPSEKVSIFLDGAFIAISSLPQTTPGSNFYLYLGPDKAIKCNRKPVMDTDASAAGGLFGLSASSKIKECSFITVLHNTNAGLPLKVLIADVLPKATEDKIKVDQIEPPLASKAKSNKYLQLEMPGGFSATAGMASITTKDLNRTEDCIFKEKGGNTLLWMVHLDAGAKTAIDFHYRVTCPAELSIEIG